MFLLKGQLNSVTQKVFKRQYRPKEEFNGLNMSVELSTSRHNLIPRLQDVFMKNKVVDSQNKVADYKNKLVD
jgi:hypothetical protein